MVPMSKSVSRGFTYTTLYHPSKSHRRYFSYIFLLQKKDIKNIIFCQAFTQEKVGQGALMTKWRGIDQVGLLRVDLQHIQLHWEQASDLDFWLVANKSVRIYGYFIYYMKPDEKD